MAEFIFTDEGDFIAAASVQSIKQSGDAVLIYFKASPFKPGISNNEQSSQQYIKYKYASAAVAAVQFAKYTSAFLSSPNPLVWGSVSPNSFSHLAVVQLVFTGSGFFGSGIIDIQAVSGMNVIAVQCTINNDTTITTNNLTLPTPGTYALNYTVDGTNFPTTGLSVVST